MRILRDDLTAFVAAPEIADEDLSTVCPFDKKTREQIRIAPSTESRSAPSARKHSKGELAAGVTRAGIASTFALTMQKSAGAEECRTTGMFSELPTADDIGAST